MAAQAQEVAENKERLVVRAVRDAIAENAENLVEGAASGVGGGGLRADGEHYEHELQRHDGGRGGCDNVDDRREEG